MERRKLYLHAGGRGQGLKQLLLDQTYEKRAKKCHTCNPGNSGNSENPHSMYQRSGFRPLPVEHLSPCCDQAWVLEFRPIDSAYADRHHFGHAWSRAQCGS